MIWTGKIELTSAQVEYIVAMKKTGLYGSNVNEVVAGLIEAGIRSAIECKHIAVREFHDEPETQS